MPAYQVHTCVDRNPEGHLVTNWTVATGESLHCRNHSIAILKMLPFVKIGQHPTDVNGPVAELSQLPVNHEKTVGRLARMTSVLPFSVQKQDTGT